MTHRDNVSVGPVRARLCQIVQENPGIHFRALGRAATITSVGQLRHHLDWLGRHGLLVEVQDGSYKCFFLAGEQDPRVRPEIARLSRDLARLIVTLLLERPMTRTELRKRLGCADSTLGAHLARMIEQGELEKTRDANHSVYRLAQPDLVQEALRQRRAGSVSVRPPQDASPDRTTFPHDLLVPRARNREPGPFAPDGA